MKTVSLVCAVCFAAAVPAVEQSLDRAVVGDWVGSIPKAAVDASETAGEASVAIRFSFRADGTFTVAAGEKKLAGRWAITRGPAGTFLWLRYENRSGVSARFILPDADSMRLENVVLVASDPKPTELVLRRQR